MSADPDKLRLAIGGGRVFTFEIDVEIHDPHALFEAAKLHAKVHDGMTLEESEAHHRPDGEIDIGACLVTLLDPSTLPGCDILGSTTEEL